MPRNDSLLPSEEPESRALLRFYPCDDLGYSEVTISPKTLVPTSEKRHHRIIDISASRFGLDCPGSNPSGGEIIRTRPDRPWGPPSLLYNKYWVSCPGVKWPGRGVNHPPPSSAEVKERVEIYLYFPSGRPWPVLG